MDLIIMLSHWRKDCLDQLLTQPPAIIPTVLQQEAWRLRQSVDPNTWYSVYVNVLFPKHDLLNYSSAESTEIWVY